MNRWLTLAPSAPAVALAAGGASCVACHLTFAPTLEVVPPPAPLR